MTPAKQKRRTRQAVDTASLLLALRDSDGGRIVTPDQVVAWLRAQVAGGAG